MLRVLVVLPFYGGSLPVGRYCLSALREIGCLAEAFEAPSFFPAYTALKELNISSDSLDSLQNSFLQFISQTVVAKAESFEPDLVLCLAQAPLNRLALKKLRDAGVPTAMWFVEDFRLFTYWRAFAPYYDIFAVIQKSPFVEELQQIGVNNVLYLPLAAEPSIHRPLTPGEDERREFGAEVSFMGAGYPNRRKAFAWLAEQDATLARKLKIWGTEWEDDPSLAPLIQRQGARISTEDCVRIFSATDININLHSSVHIQEPVSRGDFVNPRTFEVAACEAFQLVDERGLMPDMFAGDEMAVFDSLADLLEKIHHFRQRPDERRAYAEKARQRVLAEHTYAHRMLKLLDFAGERLPGFGSRKPVPWPENMPEDMRHSMETLMRELQLPASASFDDVVAAVRNKSDALSDAEAALLFLDEWRKLYSK